MSNLIKLEIILCQVLQARLLFYTYLFLFFRITDNVVSTILQDEECNIPKA